MSVNPAPNGAEPTQETPKGQAIARHKSELFENKWETALSDEATRRISRTGQDYPP
jgi:hypothetical protein